MKKSLLGISLLTISCLYFLLAAIIILITILTDIPVIYGIESSIIILVIQFLISPFITDLSMKWFYKTNFNYTIPSYLQDFIEEVCKKNNMKKPRIGYIDDGAPNAFTYGHTKNDARIILTRGIYELLTEEEVKTVVGHELGHATHYDMLLMTVAQLVPLILYAIYETFADKGDDDNSYGLIISIIAYVFYVISNYLVLALSRTREYYADNFSLEETRNPNALASALVKVGYGLSTAETNKKHSVAKSNALGIFDSNTSKSLVVTSMDNNGISKNNIKQAMKWEEWNIWAKWYELHSTHPLISKRLLNISSRSKEFNQEPYITFDLKKEESYTDDFMVEVGISFLPLVPLIIGIPLACMSENPLRIMGITILLMVLACYIKFKRQYPNKEYPKRNVRDLLGEVKVSHITALPCSLEGTIIGRGNPGCIFNEDFVLKDDTGIIFIDYNQPVFLLNIFFALFQSKEYFDKNVKVKGWYRRSPVPYVEVLSIEMDGKTKEICTYALKKLAFIIGILFSIFLIMK